MDGKAVDVFISYSTKDEILTATISHVLDKAGISNWFAPKDLLGGTSFAWKIQEGIQNCRCVVVVASGHINQSEHVDNEIESALSQGKTIIPYRVSRDMHKPRLDLFQWIDAVGDPYDKFDDLIAAVRRVLDGQTGGTAEPASCGPIHEIKNLSRIKTIKKASGKIALLLLAAEAALLCLYAAMNLWPWCFAVLTVIVPAAFLYPVLERGRCAFAGCRKPGHRRNTKVIFGKGRTAMLGLCNEHKHTLDMYKSRKPAIAVYYGSAALVAAAMTICAFHYQIRPSMLVTPVSLDALASFEVDFDTAQAMAASLAAQSENTLCVAADGGVYVYDPGPWGDAVDRWNGVTRLSAGESHVAALRYDGTALAAGENAMGECDLGSLKGTDILDIAAGDHFTVALTRDGLLLGAGSNDEGQLDFTGAGGITAVSAGSAHTLALTREGTVLAFGNNDYGQCEVSDWTGIVQVSAGGNISAGLAGDGTVVTTAGGVGWTGIVAVCAGDGLVAGLTGDGRVLLAGDESNRMAEVSDWKDIIAMDLQGTHLVGLTAEHILVDASPGGAHWTDPQISGLGAAPNSDARVLEAAKKLAAAPAFGLTLAGDELSAGGGFPGFRLVGFDHLVLIRASENTVAGLREDATVILSRLEDSPIQPVDWQGIVMVDLSRNHLVGLRSDGSVAAAGDNSCGQLDVEDFRDIVYITAAATHTIAVREDGTVTAAGDNRYGQCDVGDLRDIRMADTGAYHTAAVRRDGTVAAVGSNDAGQCDVEGWTDIAWVAVGDTFTLGLRRDGSVVAAGRVDLPVAASPIVAIDASGGAYCMLDENGALIDSYQ